LYHIRLLADGCLRQGFGGQAEQAQNI